MKKEFRIMIAGSRTFNDYQLVCKTLEEELSKRNIIKDKYNIIIISGKAKGADELGELYARDNNLIVEEYPAKWDDLKVTPCKVKYNKWGKPYNCLAGMNRNTDMINVSDLVIIFWDSKSKGSLDDINKCKKWNKDYVLVEYKKLRRVK